MPLIEETQGFRGWKRSFRQTDRRPNHLSQTALRDRFASATVAAVTQTIQTQPAAHVRNNTVSAAGGWRFEPRRASGVDVRLAATPKVLPPSHVRLPESHLPVNPHPTDPTK